jgi:hypothetical protein
MPLFRRRKREPEELTRQELRQERKVVKYRKERLKLAAEHSRAKHKLKTAESKAEIRRMQKRTKELKPPSRWSSAVGAVRSELTPSKAKRRKKRRRRKRAPVRTGGIRYDPGDMSLW